MIAPYGGTLVDLTVQGEERSDLARRAAGLASIQLSPRALCDLELLATGAFSPLDRFMRKADAERVAAEMRLTGGTLFPIPITLPADRIDGIDGREIALRSGHNNLIGWMKVEEVYEWTREMQAAASSGAMHSGRYRLSGPLRVLDLPPHPDFPSLRRTPREARAALASMGRANVVAFPTSRAFGRGPAESVLAAAREADAGVLIQMVAGAVAPGDAAHHARVRSWQRQAERHFDPGRVLLNLLPLVTRAAGAREALWQAIVERNFGASHLLMEAGEACDLVNFHRAEIGLQAMPYEAAAHAEGFEAASPANGRKGFCIWFTGLPSSGKSTIAQALIGMLMEHGRQVTVLDGDVVRTHLSKGLGFSREDRDTNILRIGFVASEIVRHGGAVICAAVSPYRHTRDQARAMVAAHAPEGDAFVEVFVDTPAEECERRDVKGYYAQAREGKIKGFTGVDDPYEPPLAPEVRLSTTGTTAVQNAERIVEFLDARGLLV